MKKKDYLFHLVKSLTKSEKRFFKLFCSLQGKPKNYMQLFDVIEKMKTYDESLFAKKIADKKITKNISVYKNYLYNQILKSLRVNHDNESVERELFSLITEADILTEKTLTQPAQNRLDKAFKLAETHHKYPLALLILQRKLVTAVKDSKRGLVEEVEQLYLDSLEKMEAFKEEFFNALLYRRIFVINRRNKRIEIDSMLEAVMPDFECLKVPTSKSFYAQLYYLKSNAYFYLLNKKRKDSYGFFKKVVDHWQAHPPLIKENSKIYKIDLCNLLHSAYTTERFDEFPPILKTVKGIKSTTIDEEVETFSSVYFLELLYYLNCNLFDQALALVPEIKAGLDKYEEQLPVGRTTTFYYNLSILYIALEDYENALEWLNKILHSDRVDSREDIQRAARIFELIIHFELENDRVLEYLFDSTYNNLTKEKAIHSFEAVCLRYLKKLPYTISSKEQQQLLVEFEDDLNQLPANSRIRGAEEISIWLQSKIQKLPFLEILIKRSEA